MKTAVRSSLLTILLVSWFSIPLLAKTATVIRDTEAAELRTNVDVSAGGGSESWQSSVFVTFVSLLCEINWATAP